MVLVTDATAHSMFSSFSVHYKRMNQYESLFISITISLLALLFYCKWSKKQLFLLSVPNCEWLTFRKVMIGWHWQLIESAESWHELSALCAHRRAQCWNTGILGLLLVWWKESITTTALLHFCQRDGKGYCKSLSDSSVDMRLDKIACMQYSIQGHVVILCSLHSDVVSDLN